MIGKNWMKHHYLKKKDFCSHLNMYHITKADYAHTKRFCKVFKMRRNVGDFHDLYVQSDTL